MVDNLSLKLNGQPKMYNGITVTPDQCKTITNNYRTKRTT